MQHNLKLIQFSRMFGSFVLAALFSLVQSEQTQNQSTPVMLGQLRNGQLELRCVTADIEKAVAWNTPIEEKFIPKVVNNWDNNLRQNNLNWEAVTSSTRNFGLILDERWEDFPIKYTDQDTSVVHKINSNSPKHYIPISANFKVDGHIYICKSQSPKAPISCFLIILRGNGGISELRRCAENGTRLKDCQINLRQNSTSKMNKNEWAHFTVVLDNDKKSISVSFHGDETPFLYYHDNKLVYDVDEILVKSEVEDAGFWKFHDYPVYTLRHQDKDKDYKTFELYPQINSDCISMYVSICDTCSIVLKIVYNEGEPPVHEETHSKKKGSTWQKIMMKLQFDASLRFVKLYIKVTGELRDKDHIFISYIKNASPRSNACVLNEVKYSFVQIDPEDRQNLSCQYLKGPKHGAVKLQEASLVSGNHCKAEEVGSMCLSCLSIYKQPQCKQTIICEDDGCQCSTGYEGFLCNFLQSNVGNVTWSSSDATISLEWSAPINSNGAIIEYTVSYKHDVYISCYPNLDENSRGEITTTNTAIILENLRAISTYTVRIGVSTKFPLGETIEIIIETKLSYELDKDAYEITIDEKGTSIDLQFVKKDCAKVKGPAQFDVITSCSDYWCNETTSQTFNEPFYSNYHIYQLHPITKYNLTIILHNSMNSLELFTKTVTTKPSNPHRVRNFEVYEVRGDSLLMRWTPPEPPTGVIEQYSVETRFGTQKRDRERIEAHKCQVWTDMMCAELKDAAGIGFEYEIWIRSKNENVDLWSLVTKTVVVFKVTAPESPNILDAMWDNGYNFTFRWQHPDKTNGPLRTFIIKKDGEEFYIFKVTEYNLTYQITQEVYPESPTYHLEIYAVNTEFNSTPSTILVQNPPKRPKIIEPISYKELTNNTAKLFVPAPINLEYLSYTYIIVTEPGSKDCNHSASASQYINDFKGCNVWFAREIVNQEKQGEIVLGDMSTQRSYNLNETIVNLPLKLYTKYELFVVVMNVNNNFKRFSVSKALSVSLEPTKVMLPCYTSCKIRFNAKKYPGSSRNVYLIRYKEKNQTIWANSSALLFSDNFETLYGFKKSTSYTLRIYLFRGEELELKKPELNFTTSCRHVRFENISLIVANISADLNLNSGYQKEICDLNDYKLIVSGSEYNKTLKPFNKIEHLKPVTTYNISITDNSYNLFTNFTTSEGSPEKVLNITWNSSETTITLEWKKPKITNGKLLGYKISYQHTLYKSCIYIESDDNSCGEITTRNTRIVLENLNPNSNYTVSIDAFTNLPGTLLEIEVSTKPRDELHKDAYEISASEYGTTIGLHFWPSCSKIKAPLKIGVILSCAKFACNETTITIDPLIISYTLRDLIPFTEYQLKFLLLNDVRSIELFTQTLTTESGIPDPVTYFESYGRGDKTLLMRWQPEEPPTGIIERYFFSAKFYRYGSWSDGKVQASEPFRCNYWPHMICAEIKGVLNELRYRITITAKNKNVDTLSESVTIEVPAMEVKQSGSFYVCLLLVLLLFLPIGRIYFVRYNKFKRVYRNRRVSVSDISEDGSPDSTSI